MSPLGKPGRADYLDAPDRPFTSRTSHMIVYQNFEWDFREAAENFDTYGVAFREAATVFTAEDVAITEDVGSDRLLARGSSWRGRMLIVLHTRGVRIRILRAMLQQQEDAAEATPVIGSTADTTEPLATVAQDADEDVVEVAEDEDAGTTENADPGVSSIADPDASLVEAPGTTEIEELPPIGGNTGAVSTVTEIGEAADEPEVDEIEAGEARDLGPATLPAVAETHTAHAFEPGDAIVATIDQVVEAKEIPASETPARPRRRIVPHRPRTNDSTPPVPDSRDITKAAEVDVIKPDDAILKAKEIPDAALPARRRPPRVPREDANAPLPAIVDRNQVVMSVAGPAPKPEETPTPEPVTEQTRRRGRPRGEASKSTTQLVLAFTKPEGNKPEAVASGAPSGSRIPGADMTADEYGVYWDAYVAARDEAKRQGKSLREAQRIGREAGDRAVARGVPVSRAAEPSQKAPKLAAKATKPVAPKAPEPAQKHKPATTERPTAKAKAPEPTQKHKPATTTEPAAKAKAPEPAAPKPSRKRATSWRAAARALK